MIIQVFLYFLFQQSKDIFCTFLTYGSLYVTRGLRCFLFFTCNRCIWVESNVEVFKQHHGLLHDIQMFYLLQKSCTKQGFVEKYFCLITVRGPMVIASHRAADIFLAASLFLSVRLRWSPRLSGHRF